MKLFMFIMFILFAAVLVITSPRVGLSAEKFSVIININSTGKNYNAELEDNATVRDILKGVPLQLDMQRYAGHEYYAELPFRPEFAPERTSHLEAGHIYYWDGWNSFVINYEESNIAPYKAVHVGRINNADEICDYLRNASENVSVNIK